MCAGVICERGEEWVEEGEEDPYDEWRLLCMRADPCCEPLEFPPRWKEEGNPEGAAEEREEGWRKVEGANATEEEWMGAVRGSGRLFVRLLLGLPTEASGFCLMLFRTLR
jgi:hypothetical protein